MYDTRWKESVVQIYAQIFEGSRHVKFFHNSKLLLRVLWSTGKMYQVRPMALNVLNVVASPAPPGSLVSATRFGKHPNFGAWR